MRGLPENRRLLLRAALEGRVYAVRARLAATGDPPADCRLRPPAAAPQEVEEHLRVAMVRLWPQIKRGGSAREHFAEYFSRLDAVANAAEKGDLRCLDAWNNAYETLVKLPSADFGDRAGFYQRYLQLLEANLRLLAA